IKTDLRGGYSKTLAEVAREKESEEQTVADELQEELARRARPAEEAWRELPGLADMVKEGGDEARLKLRPVLRQLVEAVPVLVVKGASWQRAAVQVCCRGATVRHSLIPRQSAANRRPGGWWVRSLASPAIPGDLDLRDRGHARRL